MIDFRMGWNPQIIRNIILSGSLIVLLVAIRFFILTSINRSSTMGPDVKRRWGVQVKNLIFLTMFLALITVWGSELRTFVLSVVAIAMALVLATKELIVCFLGGVLKFSSKPFSTGDRIVVGEMRGDVIDQDLLTTTLLEIGPGELFHQHTGRAVTIPNSMLFTTPVINETYAHLYSLHTFIIPLRTKDDWRFHEKMLLQAGIDESMSYQADAKKYLESVAVKRGLDIPTTDPRVSIHFPKAGKMDLALRIPVPTLKKGKVEQAVIHRYLDFIAEKVKSEI